MVARTLLWGMINAVQVKKTNDLSENQQTENIQKVGRKIWEDMKNIQD